MKSGWFISCREALDRNSKNLPYLTHGDICNSPFDRKQKGGYGVCCCPRTWDFQGYIVLSSVVRCSLKAPRLAVSQNCVELRTHTWVRKSEMEAKHVSDKHGAVNTAETDYSAVTNSRIDSIHSNWLHSNWMKCSSQIKEMKSPLLLLFLSPLTPPPTNKAARSC